MPSSSALWLRIQGRYRRTASAWCAKREFSLRNTQPIISFTFDDFPRSALHIAGDILTEHGTVGTYYTSLGLMGTTAPTGRIFDREDLPLLLARRHELGCHTFHHHHAYDTTPDVFEASLIQNQCVLQEFCPGEKFLTHSYPISCPRPGNKRASARHYAAARAGGQTFNHGLIDRENLQSFFLEQSRDRPDAVKAMIDACVARQGWLIFSTHDVEPSPTRYGCTPEFFRDIVRHAAASGARLLPVNEALRVCGLSLPTGTAA